MSSNVRLLGDAARLVDARSSRSTQKQVGASEIGVCRRRAGYVHHRQAPSNPENLTGMPAILGTWLHHGALDTMARQWGSLTEVGVEHEVLRGHVDAVELPNDLREVAGLKPVDGSPDVVVVDDLKSRRDGRMIDYVRNKGPKRAELFQVHLYARLLREGLIGRLDGKALKNVERQLRLVADTMGGTIPVETVRLRYFSRAGERDDHAQEYVYEQDYDPDVASEAWEWVEEVARSTRPEDLPRDEDGPGLSVICDNCPFRRDCWGEENGHAPQAQLIVTDADLAAVLADYDTARQIASVADADKKRARAILDATRPAIYTAPGSTEGYKLGWGGGGAMDPKPDVDRMVELFAKAGLEVPYLQPKASARTIHVTRWEVPDPECGKPIGDPVAVVIDDLGQTITQDRQRGGWTIYGPTGDEIGTCTAKAALSHLPDDYVEPRPLCVLKKGHSGDCHDASFVVELDLDADELDDVDEAG